MYKVNVLGEKQLENEIQKYMSNVNEVHGALLIDGEWGIGKTTVIMKKDFIKVKNKNEIKIKYISLFGIEKFENFLNIVFYEVANNKNKLKKFVCNNILNSSLSLSAPLIPFALGINLKGKTEDNKTINKKISKIEKELIKSVLIFDDLERISFSPELFFGYIDNLIIANPRQKIIILSNYSEFMNKKVDIHKEFIEKIIFKHIIFKRDFSFFLDSRGAIINKLLNLNLNFALVKVFKNEINWISKKLEYNCRNFIRMLNEHRYVIEQLNNFCSLDYSTIKHCLNAIIYTFCDEKSNEINTIYFEKFPNIIYSGILEKPITEAVSIENIRSYIQWWNGMKKNYGKDIKFIDLTSDYIEGSSKNCLKKDEIEIDLNNLIDKINQGFISVNFFPMILKNLSLLNCCDLIKEELYNSFFKEIRNIFKNLTLVEARRWLIEGYLNDLELDSNFDYSNFICMKKINYEIVSSLEENIFKNHSKILKNEYGTIIDTLRDVLTISEKLQVSTCDIWYKLLKEYFINKCNNYENLNNLLHIFPNYANPNLYKPMYFSDFYTILIKKYPKWQDNIHYLLDLQAWNKLTQEIQDIKQKLKDNKKIEIITKFEKQVQKIIKNLSSGLSKLKKSN